MEKIKMIFGSDDPTPMADFQQICDLNKKLQKIRIIAKELADLSFENLGVDRYDENGVFSYCDYSWDLGQKILKIIDDQK